MGGGGGVGCYIRSQAPARRKNAWPEPSNFKNRDEIDTSTKQLIRQFNSEVANLTGGGGGGGSALENGRSTVTDTCILHDVSHVSLSVH